MLFRSDKVIMRKLDALVAEFPEVFQCIGETDIDKTYTIPKSRVKYVSREGDPAQRESSQEKR